VSNLSILIKPASGLCNLNCQYCFYYDVMKHREVKSHGFMTENTLEQIVKRAFDYANRSVTFVFQGGEPTLVGLPFYHKLIEFVELYNSNKIQVFYSIQTNGMNIDQDWAAFFKKNHFLIGLSMDGPKEIHDCNRTDALRNGTFQRVNKASQILSRYQVEVNVLCVVSKNVAKHPMSVYQFFKKNKYRYLQFIPCLDELEEEPGTKKYSLLPEDYGQFLCDVFDLWYQDFKNDVRISIRMFDNIISILLGYPPESCDMFGQCSINAVIEGNGAVYPCDFYVLDEWFMGNINDMSFHELKDQSAAKRFVESSLQNNSECRNCKFVNLCRTGCRRHREQMAEGGLSKNYFCSSYQQFYEHTLPRWKEIAGIISKEMQNQ